MSYEEIETFIDNLAVKSAKELIRLNEALNKDDQPVSTSSVVKLNCEETGEDIDSNFCFGTAPCQKKARRCYLDRYIHPSWTEADSQSCIEWIRAFREVDVMQHGRVSDLLRQLWTEERSSR
jgi:hypothetical protein